MKKFIDFTIFIGMNSNNEKIRIVCKNFFVENFSQNVFISFESIGKCDDMVWSLDKKLQDDYFPFMDRLNTVMKIRRVPYTKKDLGRIKSRRNISLFQELTLAQAFGNRLYTLDKDLLKLDLDYVLKPKEIAKEKNFPAYLEELYKKSLNLRFKI